MKKEIIITGVVLGLIGAGVVIKKVFFPSENNAIEAEKEAPKKKKKTKKKKTASKKASKKKGKRA